MRQVILDPAASHHTLVLMVEGLAHFTFADPAGNVIKGDMPLLRFLRGPARPYEGA